MHREAPVLDCERKGKDMDHNYAPPGYRAEPAHTVIDDKGRGWAICKGCAFLGDPLGCGDAPLFCRAVLHADRQAARLVRVYHEVDHV